VVNSGEKKMKSKNCKGEANVAVPRRYLKASAASEYMGISRRYLHDLSSQGRIPFHKIGPRCFVYSTADLDAFLASCRIGGGE